MSETWLDESLLHHARLMPAVVTILKSVLKAKSIEYLSVSGRIKDRSNALEKIKRKGYVDLDRQMTDLTGVRVVLFSESDVKAVSELMTSTFSVDKEKSLNKDDLLNTNQTGYRSIHFVCGLGSERSGLPEFKGLADLQFEVQVRTVLQHAWAELSHDRNYKFSGTLPRDLERRLFLYAGLLEIADKGFDELSKSIDQYVAEVKKKTEDGNFDTEINSISLRQFVRDWALSTGFEIDDKPFLDNHLDLLSELEQFKVKTLKDLKAIIPADYAEHAKKHKDTTINMYGVVRDWMIAHDWRRFSETVDRNWILADDENEFLLSHLGAKEYNQLLQYFGPQWIEPPDDE